MSNQKIKRVLEMKCELCGHRSTVGIDTLVGAVSIDHAVLVCPHCGEADEANEITIVGHSISGGYSDE